MTLFKIAPALCLAASAFAQPATDSAPRFEVATVKLAAPGAIRNRVAPAGPERLSIPAMNVRWLIYTAYQEGMGTSWNVSGGPEWMDDTLYAIEGQAAQPTTQHELRLMLRTLLSERFGLKVRLEDRTGGKIYALVLNGSDAPRGPNIQEWDGTCGGRPPAQANDADDPYVPRCPSGYRGTRAFFLEGGTLFSAAELLSLPPARGLLGTIVQDHTGLTGRYKLRLDYDFTPVRPGDPAGAPEIAGPSLFDAVREQWGLKLEKADGVLHMVFVESVDRPTEN